ncbi:hypothetical protein Tco_0104035, partial [Tanacetum coccineum]
MGEVTLFLGLQVTQKDDGIFISQDKYVEEILKIFGFSTVKTASTPMETSKLLLKDAEAGDVDVHLYRSMIGSLMYLTASRLDIMFVVCACARFQVTPKGSHLHDVKRIFRYLKGQPKLGLWYPKDSLFDLEAYTNSDYAGASLDRKSTIGELERMSAKTEAWNEFNSTIASAIICLATNQKFNLSKYIFDNMLKNLEGGVKFLIYPRFVQVFLDKQVEGMTRHKEVYVTPSHTKKVFANMKRRGKGFSGRATPLFQIMMVQASEDMGKDLATSTDSHSTPNITQPSTYKPQKKKSRRKQRKDSGPTEPVTDETTNEAYVATPSYDPPQSGEDRMQLSKLMNICTSLQEKVLDLEEAKTAQAKEIASLKKIAGSNPLMISYADAKVTCDETQERNNEEMLFDVHDDLQGKEVVAEKEIADKEVSTADPVTTAGEGVTTANIKAAKPKVVTTVSTTTTTTRPKARGVVVQEPSEFKTTTSPSQASQLSQAKGKGKAIMVEPKKSLKKKDQIAFDEEVSRRLEAHIQTELEEEDKLARQREEEASRAAIIKELDSIQAMIEGDEQLAARLQAEEQEQFSIEDRSRMLVEMIAERKKYFATQRAVEQRSKLPTKAQMRNRMCTYLKNMGGYKHNQLKGRSYEEIQKLFDIAYKQVNSFVPMDSEVVKGSEASTEESSKIAGDELESDKSEKQKIAIDAIPLDTKPPMIVEYKIVKEGKIGHFQLIRADGSSKRYSSMIKMFQGIDREDLETLWKLVKAKHGLRRPEADYERVLWGDLRVIVHFVRFKDLHIFMLVEKRYPVTPITITNMLNKKLQA